MCCVITCAVPVICVLTLCVTVGAVLIIMTVTVLVIDRQWTWVWGSYRCTARWSGVTCVTASARSRKASSSRTSCLCLGLALCSSAARKSGKRSKPRYNTNLKCYLYFIHWYSMESIFEDLVKFTLIKKQFVDYDCPKINKLCQVSFFW